MGVHCPPVPEASPIANLTDISVRFGRVLVLTRVNLTILPGQVVGVIGPNGSGKSTLLRVLATLLPPSTGRALVLDAELGRDNLTSTRRRLALLGHEPGLWGELTLSENLAFVGRMCGVGTGRVEAILTQVGLGGAMDRRADHSSHGMRRRVEFARVLLTRPELLLLDEAHAGLDRSAQTLVEHTIADVTSRRGAVVLVSHEPDRMLPFVDVTYQLDHGTLTPLDVHR